MKTYCPVYLDVFQKRIKQYSSLSSRLKKRVLEILNNPNFKTEPLQKDLKGLRSARVGRNFRIIFAISEEIKKNNYAANVYPQFCIFPDGNVIFITFGPHEKAYSLQ